MKASHCGGKSKNPLPHHSLEMTIEFGVKCSKGIHDERNKRSPIASGIGRTYLEFLESSWIEFFL